MSKLKIKSQCKEAEKMAQNCVAVRLRLVNRLITNIYDTELRPYKLKVSQLNILAFVAMIGECKLDTVCSKLELDTSTVSRNIEKMKTNGWIENVSSEDGRARPFQITKEGKSLLKEVYPAWKSAQKQAKEILDKSIIADLDKIVMEKWLPSQ